MAKPAAQNQVHLPADFEQVFAVAEPIGGWLTVEQAFLLYRQARAVDRPGAVIVEIGSHQGRSTVVLALAAPDSTVIAVDPFVDGAMFGGLGTKEKFEANLQRAKVTDRVELVQAKSTDRRQAWERPFELLYIDGKHDYWTVTDDLKWATHLPEGGSVLIHDAFSSIGVTLGLLRWVLPGTQLRYVGRAGSLAHFEKRRPSLADRARFIRQLPWWVRNVAIKVLLRLRLYPLARLAGHHDKADPY
ncbi:class I SAM-dependent methyltransferase [Epidermidibacterium keratini]|uniref:Class I SAM-dependent methyltransferase n=1 Tax=Epidermidibacterium keratini TaxID=1891644 RepID=A0A7L4YKK5_9ACTN|nr:class I SAM-dependent methyltransferase [Epidermidibacterium keratini]QHB99412.1 class I SAM-dependent methyltransferase [Epidermidibacterium keratini]